jgi:putative endopeptidase
MHLLCAAAAAALATASAIHAQTPVTAPPPPVTETPAVSVTAERYGAWGFDRAGQDLSVKPGDDFHRFANGKALDAMQIPPDRSSYGTGAKLAMLSEARLKTLIERSRGQVGASGSDEAKIGALYADFMDETQAERLGLEPLRPTLQAIAADRTKSDVARRMGATHGVFGMSFFGAGVEADAKDPKAHTVYLGQSGLGLPDRDYYLTPQFAEQKAKYETYIAAMLKLAGWAQPEDSAKAIVALETRIAEASWPKTDQRNPDKTYNPYTAAELATYAPGFDWRSYFEGAQLGSVPRFVVQESTAFPKIAAVFAETPVETLKAWQAFHTVDQAAPYLSKVFVDTRFDFHGKTLTGQPAQRSRDKRAVALVEQSMGEALGRIYVAEYFPPESKAKMDALVKNLLVAMRGRIERLDWMGPQTKAQALDKLSKIRVKIGYPTAWRDYGALEVRRGDLVGNVQRSGAFEWAYARGKLGKPVDPEEWVMTPQTVNAYYHPLKNEIVFPAAILQPPFFDPEADAAINYGAIGGVIGHEISHGFDDQGRKYDGDGRLRDWWTAEDGAKFDAQAKRLVAQYNAYEPLPGAKVNGQLTLGENIGDLGGVLIALDAYRASLGGKPAPVIDGLTGEQRVFLGWAQAWRTKVRDDRMRSILVSDPHSPAEARAAGPLRNVDAWYAAFDVKPGDKAYVPPAERVRIW